MTPTTQMDRWILLLLHASWTTPLDADTDGGDPAVDPGGTGTKVWYPACRLPSGTYPDLLPPVPHLARFVTGTMERAHWTRMQLPAHVWKRELGSIEVTYGVSAQVAGDEGPRTRDYLNEFGG